MDAPSRLAPPPCKCPGQGPLSGTLLPEPHLRTTNRRDKGCSSSMARPTSTALRRAALAATATTMLLALSGCSGDDGDDGPGRWRAGRPPTPPAGPAAAGDAHDDGSGLRQAPRRQPRAAEEEDRRRWSTTGSMRRTSAATGRAPATPTPTSPPARPRDAKRDAGLMSNARLGKQLESVEATKRRLRIDVLAVTPAGGRRDREVRAGDAAHRRGQPRRAGRGEPVPDLARTTAGRSSATTCRGGTHEDESDSAWSAHSRRPCSWWCSPCAGW